MGLRKLKGISVCHWHEGIQGSRVVAPLTLNLGTRWRWVVNTGRYSSRERSPGKDRTGGSVGPKAVLDIVEERNIFSPARIRILEPPAHGPITTYASRVPIFSSKSIYSIFTKIWYNSLHKHSFSCHAYLQKQFTVVKKHKRRKNSVVTSGRAEPIWTARHSSHLTQA